MILFYLGVFAFFLLCFLFCFIVLVQESKSLGLGASFGGDAGSSIFGTSTPEVLKKITTYLAVVFFLSSIFISYWAESISHVPPSTQMMIEGE